MIASTRFKIARPLAVLTLGLALAAASAGTAVAGPAPVGLGSAAGFSVLAASGMTNTGVGTIVGDIGSSPTHSQSGFAPCPAADCVDLTGTNHDDPDPNDAVTQNAKRDLVIAYDDAFGRTGGTAISAPLGGGSTLVAGVYTSASDIFVGGDLTLDGAGDPDAVFIFQAKTGTLTTAAGSTSGIPNTRVLLSNGAQACNVFWQVGSSATISTFTQFLGNVLALQSITVNTKATLDTGRVLARNGAVTLDTNTIKRATCTTPPPPASGGGQPAQGQTPAPTPTPTPTPAPSAGGSPPAAPVAGSPSTSVPAASTAPLSGTARLQGPSRPVGGAFTATVTGRAISSVTFFLNGTRIRTVRARPGLTRFRARISPRTRGGRAQRVTAVVRFTPASGTPPTRRRLTFLTRTTAQPPPRFTG